MEALSGALPPVDRETARNFEMDEQLKSLQQKMAALFRHQQSRGGIIDPDADDSKLLVTEVVNLLFGVFRLRFRVWILTHFLR